MFIVDVTIGGDTKQINLINPMHARATSGDAQENMICVNLM
jgi:hypothetical protein